MDAVKFLKEMGRMCASVKEECGRCPLPFACPFDDAPSIFADKEIEGLVDSVEKWSSEHPAKTRLMDFLEKYPNAPMVDGIPQHVIPKYLGYCSTTICLACEHKRDTYDFCWNLPLEERV